MKISYGSVIEVIQMIERVGNCLWRCTFKYCVFQLRISISNVGYEEGKEIISKQNLWKTLIDNYIMVYEIRRLGEGSGGGGSLNSL